MSKVGAEVHVQIGTKFNWEPWMSARQQNLGYAPVEDTPTLKQDTLAYIEALEKVQKRATKILPQLKHMNYSDRLKACKLPTLHYRRIPGDMIETYKILIGKYDVEIAPSLVGVCSSVTRGHSLRFKKIGQKSQNMIYASFVLLREQQIFGIHCLVMWCLLELYIVVKQDQTDFGLTRVLYIINVKKTSLEARSLTLL